MRTQNRLALSAMLSIALTFSGIIPSQADTAGSGDCTQTFTKSGTGEVAVTSTGGYCYVAFKNTGALNSQTTFTWTKPSGVSVTDVLVVGGGGGGGARHGGGGGAGALVDAPNFSLVGATNISIVVGAGGAGATGSTTYAGTTGQTSSFKNSSNGLTALGGGFGFNGATAGSGGSGGGAGSQQTPGSVTSQAQSDFAGGVLVGITFGNAGSTGARDTNDGSDLNDYWAGGGGGGAGSAGAKPTSNGVQTTDFTTGTSSTARGGNGGAGRTVAWLTTALSTTLGVGQVSSGSVYFAGGGGGGMGADGVAGGTGGVGGGANGTRAESVGNNALANTGGGGGGSGFDDIPQGTAPHPEGGDGGSGVVVVRYSITPGAPTSVATSNITPNSVQVSFTAPTHTPQSITGYQYSLNGGATWLDAAQNSSPLTITGLTSETAYSSFQIRAKSAAGGGAAASVSTFTTLKNPSDYLRVYFNSTDASSYDSASSSPNVVQNLGTTTISGTVINGSNGAISLESTTRAWNFPGGTNSTGSYIDVGDFSYSSYRSGGMTVDFEADFGSANNWERILDFGEMRDSQFGEKFNLLIARQGTSTNFEVGLWGDGSGLGTCRADNQITSGLHRWTIQLTGTSCSIWKNGSSLTVTNGSSTGTSVAFGQFPDVTITKNYIGRSNWTQDTQFEGKIRYLKIFQGAFTPSEIGPVTYNLVQFNRNGGNADPASLSTSGKVRVPQSGSVTRAGYTLSGWSDGANIYAPGALFIAPSGTTTLNAQWSPNTNSVSWDVNGGSTVATTSFQTGGTLSKPTDPTKSGKYFGGWSTTETSNQGDEANLISSWPYSPAATSGIALYAIWLEPCSPVTSSFVATGTSDLTSATYGISGRTYTQLRFNSMTKCGWTVPAGVSQADVMIVGGGGAGSYFGLAGGGGAGAVLATSNSPLALTSGSSLIVKVGAGGTFTYNSDQTQNANKGTNGGPTSFGSYSALGGGAGGGGTPASQDGQPGGSGGGAAQCGTPTGGAAGLNPNYSSFQYFANPGGNNPSYNPSDCGAAPGSMGGGGGAGSAGTNTGNGGASITRFGIEVAGGGAGFKGSAAGGGTVGGDWSNTCGSTNANLRAGVTNTGSGGASCGNGGSGTVVVRFFTEYQLSFAAGSLGTGTTQTSTKYSGVSQSLPNSATANSYFTRTNYSVTGWTTTDGGAQTHALGATFSTDADTTFYPVWTQTTFTVTYNYNGADGGTRPVESFYSGSAAVTLPSPTKTGLLLTGWYSDSGFTTFVGRAGSSYTTSQNVTLYARWTNLLINIDATDTTSMANDSSTLTSILPGASTVSTSIRTGTAGVTTSAGVRGIYVDGTADAYVFPAGTGGVTGATTVEAWIKPGDLVDGWNIIASRWFSDQNGTGSNDWHFAIRQVSGVSKLNVFTTNGSNLYADYEFPNTSLNKWFHVAFTLDSSNNLQMYVNGKPSGPLHSSAGHTNQSTALLIIGDSRTSRAGMSGIISKFRIYNKALSSAEMLSSYNADRSTFGLVTVTLNANDGSGSPATFQQHRYSGVSTALPTNTFTKSNSVFSGWTVNQDGTGTSYTDGQAVTFNSDQTLYAKWNSNYTITYNYNGATGGNTAATSSFTIGGTAVTLPVPTKTNSVFDGWYVSPTFAGSKLGNTYSPPQSITLYAKWAEVRNAPSAPENVTVTPISGGLKVDWLAPARLAGNTVTGYQVEYSSDGSIWTVSSTAVAATSRSFAVTGLTVGSSYYIRVAAKYSAGLGAYGYPWTKIYETTTRQRENDLITYTSGFGLTNGAANTYSSSAFTRIRYRLQATYGGNSNYADVDFLRTLGTKASYSETYDSISKLQVPTITGADSQFEIHAEVTDLTVESNASGVENGTGLTGRLEIWPWNYGATTATDFTSRAAGTFDDSDTPAQGVSKGLYGSFQVHRVGSITTQTILAWNRHFETESAADVGFGNNAGVNSDWTFCLINAECSNRTNFKWQSFVNIPVMVQETKTITFNANFGANPTTSSQEVVSGVSTSLVANSFTRSGFIFAGWTANSDGTGTAYSNSATISTSTDITLFAKWSSATLVVTYNKNGANGAPERSSESFTIGGQAIVLPLVGTMTKTGYLFNGWSTTQDDVATKVVGSYSPTVDTTLYALWSAASYSYSYNVNGATSGSPSVTSGTYTTGGTPITLALQSTMERTGYSFNGWSTVANSTSAKVLNSGSYTISAPVILYALWTANNYSVSYSVTGADSGTAPTDSSNYNISQSAVVKANTGNLVKAGYSFAGWTTQSNGTGTIYQSGSTYQFGAANVTFYPKFTPNTYIITYNANGATGTPAGGSTTTSYTTGDPGVSLANVGTMAKTGYDFAGWSTNPTGSVHSGGFTTAADVTLYAIWTLKDISITYNRGQISSTNLSSNEIATFPSNAVGKYGAAISLSGTVSSTITFGGNNYQFFGWNDGNSTFRSGDSFTLTEVAPTFTAQWVRLYAVRYALNGGTGIVTVDDECTQVDYTCLPNAVITLSSAPNRAGYQFTGWKDQSDNSYAASASFTVTDTKYLLYAQWQAIDYSMTFDSAGGSNAPAALTKNIGQSFVMPNPGTRNGYDFAGWSDGSVTFGTGVTYNVGVGNKTFTALWNPKTYLITYNWNGGSLVSGSAIATVSYTVGNAGLSLPSGTTYARDGYVFDGWSTTNGGTKLSGAYIPTETSMLFARWIDGEYEITYNARGGNVPRARDNVARSASVTLPTPTRAGFTFEGWYEDSGFTRRVAGGGASHQPNASGAMYAKWTQNSLVGINPAHLNTLSTTSVTGAHTWSGNHALSGTGAALNIPNGALDAGTVVNVSFVDDLTRPRNLIDNNFAYYTSVVVHWLKGTGDSATVPETANGKAITLTLTNPNIKVGSKVFMIVNGVATEVATATQSGQVTVTMTQDPEFVIAATVPDAPTNVAATAGNTHATLSWTAAASGGSDITGYTVTASNGGGSCTTTGATTCVVTGLTNGTAYTFTVTATNAIGTSTASSASASVTPALATYTVTFNSNGGSSVGNSSFPDGGSVSQPTSPTKSGFTFAGWTTVLNDSSSLVTFPYAPGVSNNITLYALWTAVTSGGSSGSSGSGSNAGSGTTSPGVVPVPKSGQKFSLPSSTVRQVTLVGENLHKVVSVKISDLPVTILKRENDKLILKLPRLNPGNYSFILDYGQNIVTEQIVQMLPQSGPKVNVGSFKGYVAIFAKEYAGKRLSAKIGKSWLVLPKVPENFARAVTLTGKDVELNVRIYIDRKLVDTIFVYTH